MILKQTHPLLRAVAKDVKNFKSRDLRVLVGDMFDTMEEHSGAGLSAPQIGIPKKLFVYGFVHNSRYPTQGPIDKDYEINPTILWRSKESTSAEEGCLSVPGLRGIVPRAVDIIYSTYDIEGVKVEKKASGFKARIIQHEIDHLHGILFTDRATSTHPEPEVVTQSSRSYKFRPH